MKPSKRHRSWHKLLLANLSSVAMEKKPKVGLFFGSFNPIHVGHLIIANHLLQQESFLEIWFVISPHNPLKKNTELLPQQHRLAMLEGAIAGNTGFVACTREFALPQPSYTHITLDVLKAENPEKDFVLIIGSDNLEVFDQWKEYAKILSTTSIMVYPRSIETLHLKNQYKQVQWADAPLIEISSTFIRSALHRGYNVQYMLPEKVYRLIQNNGWYLS